MRSLIVLLVASAAFASLVATPASAVTCGTGQNQVFYSLIQDFEGIVGVCGVGNDSVSEVNSLVPSASGNWVLADKTDNDDPTPLARFLAPLPAPGQTAWAVANPNNYPALLVVLKQSTNFAAFVLDMSLALSGNWGTEKGNSIDDLSHASLYVAGTPVNPPPPPPVTPIPLPAAGLMLVAGLGGLAVLRRRKTRA